MQSLFRLLVLVFNFVCGEGEGVRGCPPINPITEQERKKVMAAVVLTEMAGYSDHNANLKVFLVVLHEACSACLYFRDGKIFLTVLLKQGIALLLFVFQERRSF